MIRAAHRDDVYSHIHGQMRIGFVCISGHHSRLLANLLALFEFALQRERTRLAHVQPSKLLSIAEQSSTKVRTNEEVISYLRSYRTYYERRYERMKICSLLNYGVNLLILF